MEMGRFIKLFLDRKALSSKCARPVLPGDAGGARTSVVSTRCEVHDLSRKDRAKILIVSATAAHLLAPMRALAFLSP